MTSGESRLQTQTRAHEGARGGGQQDEDHPHGGGHGGSCFRCGDLARSVARRREAGVGRRRLSGTTQVSRECAPRAQDYTQRRCRYKRQVRDEAAWAENRSKSKVRAKVENVFQVMKLKFGFVKVRYRGLKKNAHRLFVTCALVNLFVSRKKLLLAA